MRRRNCEEHLAGTGTGPVTINQSANDTLEHLAGTGGAPVINQS